MTPLSSLLTESSDPLGLSLLEEHRKRYERIKAWREAQCDPYFTEVSPQWRREFCGRKQESEVRSQKTGVKTLISCLLSPDS